MDANLFTAYNYLSSAIAQAFAALIALTAMFYVYRIGRLKNQIKNLFDKFRKILALSDLNKETHDIRNRYQIFKDKMTEYELESDEKIIRLINAMRIVRGELSEDMKQKATQSKKQYEELTGLYRFLKKSIVSAIILSALAMIIGVAALLAGWWIYEVSVYLVLGIMIFESVFAAFALIFTVMAVIRMLREPIATKAIKAIEDYLSQGKILEQSQAEEGQK